MRIIPTPLTGAFVIDLEKREDERGSFARFFSSASLPRLVWKHASCRLIIP
jgi:dTDP-4-dehydrorhamnose 3,5-epimerase-like enzyme